MFFPQQRIAKLTELKTFTELLDEKLSKTKKEMEEKFANSDMTFSDQSRFFVHFNFLYIVPKILNNIEREDFNFSGGKLPGESP